MVFQPFIPPTPELQRPPPQTQSHLKPQNVIRLTLGWALDRSFTPVAPKLAPSHYLGFMDTGSSRKKGKKGFFLQKRLAVPDLLEGP